MKRPIYHHLPNTITLLSLVTGCVAIILAFQPAYLPVAPWLIVLCALLDFLDGFTARLLKAYSELGKQLDSLADVVSFGVAPGLIAFQVIQQNILAHDPGFSLLHATVLQYLMLIPALLFPAFSALRLGIFNLDTSQTYSFRGLPTPGSALFVVFLVLSFFNPSNSQRTGLLQSPWFIPACLLVLSYLMVSPLRMLSFKFANWSFRSNYLKYTLLVSGLLLLLFLRIQGALLTLLLYLLLSGIFHFSEKEK
ncbi:MAG: CDP-alcohol phosphatidyltransferase family protein [Bacteroidales bacterium]